MPPPLSSYPPKIQALIRRLKTPAQVQRWLLTLQYNKTETMHSLHGVLHHHRAHCLEAAMSAAAILEHHGFPPLILDMESADGLDHTLFLYRCRGKYGSVGFSRDVGLNGRKPVFKTIRALVRSYAIPYIDKKANILTYGVFDLRKLNNDQWRTSAKSVWFVEDALRDMPHTKLNLSPMFIKKWRQRYLAFKKRHSAKQPDYFPGQQSWL